MSCNGIVILKQGCTNVLHVSVPQSLVVKIQQPQIEKYTLEISGIGPRGATGSDAATWLWGNVNVPAAVDIVYHPLFAHTIAPIIFIDGVPFKWAKLGVIQYKRDQPGEEGQTPFLDFTGYVLGEGVISGEIDFQYLIP